MTTAAPPVSADYTTYSSGASTPSRSFSVHSSRPPPAAFAGSATASTRSQSRSSPSAAAPSPSHNPHHHNHHHHVHNNPHQHHHHNHHHSQHHHHHHHHHHHNHSHSQSSPQSRHPRRTSSLARPIQDILPQNDPETSHLASYSKRSLSRDQEHLTPPSRGAEDDSPTHQPQRRGSTRSSGRHSRPHLQNDMSPSAAPSNGSPSASSHAPANPDRPQQPPVASKQTRSRTTIPTQSGKWILGKTIGAGSMGKVKLARKEDGSEQVACKIVPRGSTDDGHQSRADKERADQSKEIRTAREAAIVTLLHHPHICGMRDVVRTNYHWYMLFEYVNGGQMLDYIISHGKLKEKQARKFSRQIASALDYCHRNSIVHRDLKIENILISKTGDIKIIDFGLSNLFSPRGHLKTFCGSLYFAAPELLQARAYTGPEVDIWSFGIVLYVLVCGKVPFDDQSMPALHAKIKKGLVDYPSWLSSECKHLMSRMLVTDPKQRATMQEVMCHPWMTKSFGGPPDNFLPAREPLTQPLDPEVIHAMQGFNFGSPELIKAQLTKIIESEEYQHAVKAYQRERETPQPARDAEKRRGFGFDFYKRRSSGNSRDTLTAPSAEALQLGHDPLYAFSPLLSIYYLVKEKQDREGDSPQHGAVSSREKEKERDREQRDKAAADPLPATIAPPQAAHTNSSAYEMPGEKPTGGRTRPRARTHGEDDAPEMVKPTRHSHHPHAQPQPLAPPQPQQPPETRASQLQKKEGTAAGLLRRFSTRKRRDPERPEKESRAHPPVVQVHSPSETPQSITPKKSFSIRRGRQSRDDQTPQTSPGLRSGGSQPQHSELLSPPISASGSRDSRKSGLGRSTSVNSAEARRVRTSDATSKDQPVTSGSDQSIAANDKAGLTKQRSHGHSKSVSLRAKSLGHARRESIQRRRLKREGAQEADVPEETDMEQEHSGVSTDRLDSSDLAKPVFLKGLFSVSTTSGKSVPTIRADIRRVLRQLNVEYIEIKGGFSCSHAPSIDLNKVQDPPGSPSNMPGHRRRFSLGGLMRGDDRDRDDIREMDRDRVPTTPRTPGRPDRDRTDRDRSYSNSETSVDSIPRRNGAPRRAPGETSTQVQSDLGGSMVMEFEIFIVKVPLLSLYGIQFKRMTGNTWQYKNMADQILRELRL